MLHIQTCDQIQITLQLLTQDLDASDLHEHGCRVYLAHVASLILFPDPEDPQGPRPVFVVGHADTRVVSDDALVKGQNGLVRSLDPTDLKRKNKN
jgi:hypothetical protein